MDRLLLAFAALTALGFGLFGLLDPDGTAAAVHLAATEDFGLGELRVVYGGLWVAMGLVIGAALFSRAALPRAEGVWLCWMGLPLARVVALSMGEGGGKGLGFLAGEVAMVAVLGVGLRLARRRSA